MLSVGQSIDLYKDVGAPADIARRYRFAELEGTHVVAHTRMATESAVTPAHAHPFTAGRDFCLVHNGSLSNPHLVRKALEPLGIEFETDNDTEAACRYLRVAAARGRRSGDGGAARFQRARRVLHLPDGHGHRAPHRARRLRLQAGRRRGDRRIRRDRVRVPLAGPFAAHRARRSCSSPSPRKSIDGESEAGVALGARLRSGAGDTAGPESLPAPARGGRGRVKQIRVHHPDGAHSIACGLDAPLDVHIHGHVGYYVAGMNKHATVTVHGNAGPGGGREHDVGARTREGLRLHGRRRVGARRPARRRRRCLAAMRNLI